MWIATYHRFASRAAFLAACQAAGWQTDSLGPLLPHGVACDEVGPLLARPTVGENGVPIPGEVLDARWHVNLAWHAQPVPAAFAASQVEPEAPARTFGITAPEPPPPPVPQTISAWKGKAILQQQGMLETVEAAVATADDFVKLAWAGAATWDRDSAFLQALAGTPGIDLTPSEVDAFFIAADQIPS